MATLVKYDETKAVNYYDPGFCCGNELTIDIQYSGAGYYIGTMCPECGPYDRHSAHYFKTRQEAEQAHMSGAYMPKF